jgi:hypothetical protein
MAPILLAMILMAQPSKACFVDLPETECIPQFITATQLLDMPNCGRVTSPLSEDVTAVRCEYLENRLLLFFTDKKQYRRYYDLIEKLSSILSIEFH